MNTYMRNIAVDLISRVIGLANLHENKVLAFYSIKHNGL